ncbi:NADH-ubiquinone oxidoreductase-F iron-sulfur binding region domain-containing protein [Haloprofundus sp. MHR1]|uniref:NADH-ubiquinone oxidoreductase-F iron-sulfur binding region domain-containing protein n=1 Tax=Haloprofundus sp. MHR1 TaxID=2572921 RepID=UPI0010BF08FE|nr:NADH-ubiquinone oxidoreductase-F iron-sulfur binding region domain-containing protein [Haloprofundus sp. MHR1]QCJ47396.1 NADH dehydrogenase FAD-containing subunit [Haloprofundus sp. MHR1]
MTDHTEPNAVVRICVGSAGDDARATAEAARAAADDVRVVDTGPTGVGGDAPLVLATRRGETTFYRGCGPERVTRVVEALEGGEVEPGDATVEHDAERRTLPVPEDGPLSVGRRRVLARCGWVDPVDAAAVDEWATDVAGDADANDANDAIELVRSVGLLGRGRGDATPDGPIATEWDAARETDGDPVLVVNANESDRRNETDRTLVEGDPVAVLDGALAVADLVGVEAEDIVVYLNEADALAGDRMRAAVDSLAEARDLDEEPQVVTGPDRYIAGEPTMALEALEGNDRLEARLRPPSPARHGLYGRPTLVHTPRTLAQVRELLLRPENFDAGDADPGTRLVTVTGDVDAPATVELSTGGSLSSVRDAVEFAGPLKMACVGGQFGGFTRTLEHTPSAPALAGAELGTEGVVELFDDSRCAVATAGGRSRFARDENCGRCVPCREGSKQLLNKLRGVYDGEFDDDGLRELTRVMRTTSTCAFGSSAARAITTAMDQFETEFRAHADGRCPSGACEEA